MPMTLKVGLSKKVAPSSSDATEACCHIEVELDPSLLRDDQDAFHRQVRNTFATCRKAVDEELASEKPAAASNGHSDPPSGGSRSRTNGRPATTSQVRAIHAIANQLRLDLAAELRSRFGVERPNDLSLREASQLIDSLKATSNAADGRST